MDDTRWRIDDRNKDFVCQMNKRFLIYTKVRNTVQSRKWAHIIDFEKCPYDIWVLLTEMANIIFDIKNCVGPIILFFLFEIIQYFDDLITYLFFQMHLANFVKKAVFGDEFIVFFEACLLTKVRTMSEFVFYTLF